MPDSSLILRQVILRAATDARVRRFVDRYGMRLGGERFVAGTTLDDAVGVLRRLNELGLLTNTTLLGEHVTEDQAANEVAAIYERVLERISAEALRTNVALKLTHLGLEFGEEIAYANVARVVEKAAELGNFIRIDMEESQWVDATLRIYRRLREAGYDNVGTVLQAYLYRTEADLESLLDLKPNLRLVKGAYLEPESVAYPLKQDVDDAYRRLLERMLVDCSYIGVATQVVVRTSAGTVQVFAQNIDAGGRVPPPGSNVVLSWSPESTFVVDRGEEETE